MKIRTTLKWLAFLIVVAGIGGAGTAWWFWRHSDEMLRQSLLERFAQAAPDWDVTIAEARFDWQNHSRVDLTDLQLKPKGDPYVLLSIPRATIQLDGDLLEEDFQVLLRRLEISDPHVTLVRYSDGSWNFDRLQKPKLLQTAGFPEVIVRRASVEVVLHHDRTRFSTTLSVREGELQFVPKGRGVYQIGGEADLHRAGTLKLDGVWDLEHKQWRLDGGMQDVALDDDLKSLLSDTSPPTREELMRLEDQLREFAGRYASDAAPAGNRSLGLNISAIGHAGGPPAEVPPLVQAAYQKPVDSQTESEAIPDFGLSGSINLNFRLSKTPDESVVDYRFLVSIVKGQLNNPILPFPLRDVAAKVYLDRHQLLVRDARAVNGDTEIALAADLNVIGPATPGQIRAKVVHLPVTKQLKKILRPDVQKTFDLLNPSGDLDFEGTFDYDGFGTWTPSGVTYRFREGTVLPSPFPYRVRDISGTIVPQTLENGEIHFQFNFQGAMGQQAVSLIGHSRPRNQGGEAIFDVWVKDLPVDDMLLSACKPEVRKALESLNIRGRGDMFLRLIRPPGEGRKFRQIISIDLLNASVTYDRFPYEVNGVTAKISYDSDTGLWQFDNIEGKHGDATVVASGTYSKLTHPNRLELKLVLNDAPIDHQLERAMREDLHRVWDELSPQGRVTVAGRIEYIPERKYLDVTFPDIRIQDGSLLMREFRYPLDDVQARLSYADRRVEIRELKARHEDTRIQGVGEFVQEPVDLWRLRFEQLIVDDLIPDRTFRQALPDSLRAGLETLDPTGPISLEARDPNAGAVEFRGSSRPDTPVTAAWDLKIAMAGSRLNAGIEIDNVQGIVTAAGTWDGRTVQGGGEVAIESAMVLDQQLTKIRGPYRFVDNQIVAGSREVALRRQQAAPNNERITAEAFKGTLAFDAVALIGADKRDEFGRLPADPTRYWVSMSVNDAKLEEYASRNLPGANDLRGRINGKITLEGSGNSSKNLTGQGRVIIKPAALYQLPLVIQIFRQLPFTLADNTAFDEADLVFSIRNDQFEFSRIDLRGNALALRGRGTVRFDEQVDLLFFSTSPKGRIPIPFVGEAVNATSVGLIAVKVDGTIGQPKTRVQTNLVIDNALRAFLGGFTPLFPMNPGARPTGPLTPMGRTGRSRFTPKR